MPAGASQGDQASHPAAEGSKGLPADDSATASEGFIGQDLLTPGKEESDLVAGESSKDAPADQGPAALPSSEDTGSKSEQTPNAGGSPNPRSEIKGNGSAQGNGAQSAADPSGARTSADTEAAVPGFESDEGSQSPSEPADHGTGPKAIPDMVTEEDLEESEDDVSDADDSEADSAEQDTPASGGVPERENGTSPKATPDIVTEEEDLEESEDDASDADDSEADSAKQDTPASDGVPERQDGTGPKASLDTLLNP